jgi:hypothetical protein
MFCSWLNCRAIRQIEGLALADLLRELLTFSWSTAPEPARPATNIAHPEDARGNPFRLKQFKASISRPCRRTKWACR